MFKWLIVNWFPVTTIAGLFSLLVSNFYFTWTNNLNSKNKETSKETIDLLNDKIKAMKLFQDDLEKRITELSSQLERLQKTNAEQAAELQRYILVFQGKDQDTISFHSRALTALEQVGKIVPIITENYQVSLDNGTRIDKLSTLITDKLTIKKKGKG